MTIIKNILISGAAGQGIDTAAVIFEDALFAAGYHVFSNKDYMSRVRGGNNFVQIRFSENELHSHSDILDLCIALDEEALTINKDLSSSIPFVADKSLEKEHGNHLYSEDFRTMAKDSGSEKAFTSAISGYVWKYFGLDIQILKDTINKNFNEKLADINVKAAQKGFDAGQIKEALSPKQKHDDHIFINGNQALAFGSFMAGCKFYCAYPMTPSTSVMNELAKYAQTYPIIVEQAEDEIAAINMAIGSSFAGVRSMTGTSGGGLSLMVEGIGLSGISETPLVIINAMRPGPATGFATRTAQGDLSFILTASQGEFPRVVLAPKDQADCFRISLRAFELADKYQLPVFILTDQFLADARKNIKEFDPEEYIVSSYLADDLNMDDYTYQRYKLTENGISPRIYPGQYDNQVVLHDSYEHDERGHDTESAYYGTAMMDKRMKKEELVKDDLIEPELLGVPYAGTMILSWGSSYGAVKEAIERLNEGGFSVFGLHFSDLWPLPVKNLKKFCAKSQHLITVEHNYTGQLAKLVKQETGISVTDKVLGYDGRQMSPETIYAKIKEVLS